MVNPNVTVRNNILLKKNLTNTFILGKNDTIFDITSTKIL